MCVSFYTTHAKRRGSFSYATAQLASTRPRPKTVQGRLLATGQSRRSYPALGRVPVAQGGARRFWPVAKPPKITAFGLYFPKGNVRSRLPVHSAQTGARRPFGFSQGTPQTTGFGRLISRREMSAAGNRREKAVDSHRQGRNRHGESKRLRETHREGRSRQTRLSFPRSPKRSLGSKGGSVTPEAEAPAEDSGVTETERSQAERRRSPVRQPTAVDFTGTYKRHGEIGPERRGLSGKAEAVTRSVDSEGWREGRQKR